MTARLVVLISGSGTNLQAIIDAIADGVLDAQVDLVISNRKAAYGLVRAAEAGIPTTYFPLKPYLDGGQTRDQYDLDLARLIASSQPDLIVLAGWMHILSAGFLDQFPHRVINLHPALPGAFAGTNAIERTYEAYRAGEVDTGGCMVHEVIPEVDAGRVIVAERVPIYPQDTLADFEARLHAVEHRLIVDAINKRLQAE
ncbi:MAG: phosphoribosylglycinamide formyltransferase [Anaerolineaceae bacterium]|nr:phosphoribosylglycinamide formyltransferase [Anaerolineaceae bacterium]